MKKSISLAAQAALVALATATVAVFPAGTARAADKADGTPRLVCETGPIHKTIGGSDWILYSCSDQASLIVMAPPDTAAGQSYIFLQGDVQGYRIFTEAKGDPSIAKAADAELSAMSTAAIAQLVAETKAADKRESGPEN